MNELSRYRLTVAEEKLNAAKLLFDSGYYKDAINRSYYSIFSSIRALLVEDKVNSSQHEEVISFFQNEYIKNGAFEKEYLDLEKNAFCTCNQCDTDDYYITSKEEASEQLENAKKMLERVRKYYYG